MTNGGRPLRTPRRPPPRSSTQPVEGDRRDDRDRQDGRSSPSYAAALTSGMAFFVLYAEAPRTGFLLLASTGFGIALTFRTIGVVLLPGFFLAVFTARIGRRGGLV